jgi:hypothetical protein
VVGLLLQLLLLLLLLLLLGVGRRGWNYGVV